MKDAYLFEGCLPLHDCLRFVDVPSVVHIREALCSSVRIRGRQLKSLASLIIKLSAKGSALVLHRHSLAATTPIARASK